jgi:hypothetical protein
MRELALLGFIAAAFGLGSFYATDHFGAFSGVNLVGGGLALAAAIGLGARRLRFVGGEHSRPILLRGLGLIALALLVAVAAERLATRADVRFDWTFEQRFELSEPVRELLSEVEGPLDLLLFYDPLDPRIRRTRLLAQELQRHADLRYAEYDIDNVPEEVDVYGVGGSNVFVLRQGSDFELVERPNEGAIYAALYRLLAVRSGEIAVLRGEGEGDPEDGRELGFSGFITALQTEGYSIRSLVSPALTEVPDDVDLLLLLAPKRRILPRALEAIERFLVRGGSVVAFLEPGVTSGVEAVLAKWGLETSNQIVVDPASGEGLGSEPKGICPVVYNYASHPASQGLDRNRMTFFCGARAFTLRKPQVDDQLSEIALSSPRAWLSDDLALLDGRSEPPEEAQGREDYQRIAVAGRYQRDGVETRIVAVGDADFATNRYFRALYNLDLATNAVHWAAQREARITLRPKLRTNVQFPLPVANSLELLYGIGLLVPELLLLVGGAVWLRRRAA